MAADQEPVLEFFTTKAGLREHLTRREKQASQIGGPLGREIALCISFARTALWLGTLDEAEAHLGEIRQILKRVREQPDVEKAREAKASAKKNANTRWDPTAGDRRVRNQAWCKFAAPLRAKGLSWPAIARRIKNHFHAQEAEDSIRRIIRPTKKAGH